MSTISELGWSNFRDISFAPGCPDMEPLAHSFRASDRLLRARFRLRSDVPAQYRAPAFLYLNLQKHSVPTPFRIFHSILWVATAEADLTMNICRSSRETNETAELTTINHAMRSSLHPLLVRSSTSRDDIELDPHVLLPEQ